MICPECQSENIETHLYCTNCGECLGWRCQCSTINQEESNFCKECGRSKDEITLTSEMEYINPTIYQYSKVEIAEMLRKSILLTIDDDPAIDQEKVDQIFSS